VRIWTGVAILAHGCWGLSYSGVEPVWIETIAKSRCPKFQVGEQLELIPMVSEPFAATGPYLVVAQELGYRIKSASEQIRRAFRSSSIGGRMRS
jgi:hypothetical protein